MTESHSPGLSREISVSPRRSAWNKHGTNAHKSLQNVKMKTYSRKKGDSPSNVIIHVNELCRLCLAKEEEMVSIYDDETIPLSLRIMACVNLEVSWKTWHNEYTIDSS